MTIDDAKQIKKRISSRDNLLTNIELEYLLVLYATFYICIIMLIGPFLKSHHVEPMLLFTISYSIVLWLIILYKKKIDKEYHSFNKIVDEYINELFKRFELKEILSNEEYEFLSSNLYGNKYTFFANNIKRFDLNINYNRLVGYITSHEQILQIIKSGKLTFKEELDAQKRYNEIKSLQELKETLT